VVTALPASSCGGSTPTGASSPLTTPQRGPQGGKRTRWPDQGVRASGVFLPRLHGPACCMRNAYGRRGRVWMPSRLSCTPSMAICAYSLPSHRSVSTPPYMYPAPPCSIRTSTYTVPYTAYPMTTWRLELLRRLRRCASAISTHYLCRDVGPVARTEIVIIFGPPYQRRGTAGGPLGSTGAGDVASG
jgi:hypothetical protein